FLGQRWAGADQRQYGERKQLEERRFHGWNSDREGCPVRSIKMSPSPTRWRRPLLVGQCDDSQHYAAVRRVIRLVPDFLCSCDSSRVPGIKRKIEAISGHVQSFFGTNCDVDYFPQVAG